MPNVAGFSTQVELRSAPIDPQWIVEGAPHARNHVLWNSTDRTGWAMVWDCTAGKFEWHYTVDELVHVLEGGMTVTGTDGVPRTYKAGDVVFFPAGIVAHWHIENYVRKLAYCQNQLPGAVGLPLRIARRVMGLFAKPAPRSKDQAQTRLTPQHSR